MVIIFWGEGGGGNYFTTKEPKNHVLIILALNFLELQ